MRIRSIADKSVGSAHNISVGDELLEINGHPVRDIIDYKFCLADPILRLKLKTRSAETKQVSVRKKPDQDLGLQFYPTKYRSCTNNCIFCFVHQLPRGLRKGLYFKDEDFRLSFLHGSFITLTNTSDDEIQRIVEQRLSPLYISVHTTDENLRKRIFRNTEIPHLMPLVRRLAKGRIEMHTQIVLCPGVNDGKYLQESILELSGLYPWVKSLALVPVGLTKFREKLPKITHVNKPYSEKITRMVGAWQRRFRKRLGVGFVYAADEFFTKAEVNIPTRRYYDEFYQVENGVGMMRLFLDNFRLKLSSLPRRLKRRLDITLVTGVSAFGLIKRLVDGRLNDIAGLRIRPVAVKNEFLGHSVTVTGLLSGADILAALRKQKNLGEIILLPPNCVNQDGLFLDDSTPQDIREALDRRVVVGSYDWVDTLLKLFASL